MMRVARGELANSTRARASRGFSASFKDASVRAGATRAILLPLTSITALVVARLELDALGAPIFGVLTLLLGITLLLPFADLGIGAAVTNAVASRPARGEHGALVSASLRLLSLFAVVVAACGLALTATGLWSAIAGVGNTEIRSLDRDMLLVSLLFAIGLPLGLGGRILLGLNRYPLFLVLQGSSAAITLGIVLVFRHSSTVTPFLLAPFIAQDMASCVILGIALHHLAVPFRVAVGGMLRQHPGSRQEIRRTALPMVVITIGLPVALQTDRLVLSHVSSRLELSRYAIVAMLYGPAWSIISVAGMSLWPRFAGLNTEAMAARVGAYGRAFRAFAVAGIIGGALLSLVGPLLTKVWAGTAGGGWLLWMAFGGLLFVQAAHLPGAMFLTRPEGLRFQAWCVVGMCLVNVPLSIGLAGALGASGPVIASMVTVLVFQLLTARRLILVGKARLPDLT